MATRPKLATFTTRCQLLDIFNEFSECLHICCIGRCQIVYDASPYNSTHLSLSKITLPQIIRSVVYFICKLQFFTCAVFVKAWRKSVRKMKTTSHYILSKVKLNFNKRQVAVTLESVRVRSLPIYEYVMVAIVYTVFIMIFHALSHYMIFAVFRRVIWLLPPYFKLPRFTFIFAFLYFSPRKRGSMFLPALVCVSVCVCLWPR